MREVDLVVVKGKTVPVSVYEVLDYHSEESFPNLMEVLPLFREAVSNYRAQKWDAAEARFQQCLALNPQDKLAAMYVERCDFLRQNPPQLVDGKWDGVWVLQGK